MSGNYHETLIVSEAASQKVKDLIDLLKAIGNALSTEHSFEYRPLGRFENLLNIYICEVR